MVAVSCSVQVTEPPPDPSTAPAEHTQYFVDQAVAYYKAHGLDATIAFYNSMKSVDGEWYVFIVDEDNVMISHATIPENVGQSFHDIVGSGGYPVGSLIIGAATEAGAWIDYTYINPAAEAIQWKHTWAVRHDGLIFGSGWYEDGVSKSDTAAYTQAFVDQAIRLYDAIGREAAFAYYNTPESVDDDWYVFIVDENDNTMVHPTRPELIGSSPKQRVDVRGKAYGLELVEVTEEGTWVDYYSLNPSTGYEEQKHAWAVKHDGLIFVSGWYERAEAVDDATYTQSFVHRAIQRYDAQGREAAIEYYKTSRERAGPVVHHHP